MMDFCGLLPFWSVSSRAPEKMYPKEPRNNQRLPDRPNLPEATSQRLDQDTNTTSPLEASVAKANN